LEFHSEGASPIGPWPQLFLPKPWDDEHILQKEEVDPYYFRDRGDDLGEYVIFIEHFPSGGFDNTSYPPAGLSSLNITSTLPLNPSVLLTGFLVFYKCPSVS
jgi:hypothetical protein